MLYMQNHPQPTKTAKEINFKMISVFEMKLSKHQPPKTKTKDSREMCMNMNMFQSTTTTQYMLQHSEALDFNSNLSTVNKTAL